MAKKDEPIVSPSGIVFTEETLKQLIVTVMAESQKQTMEAIAELRKPTEREQRKLDAEIKQERELRVRKVKETVQMERQDRERRFACPHFKAAEGTHGAGHAFRGQVNSDHCCRPVCVRCFKQFPPFKVSEENIKSGMNLGNAKGLTAEILYNAHMQSFPDCPECLKGNCAVRDLRELKAGKLDPIPEVLPDGKIRGEMLAV